MLLGLFVAHQPQDCPLQVQERNSFMVPMSPLCKASIAVRPPTKNLIFQAPAFLASSEASRNSVLIQPAYMWVEALLPPAYRSAREGREQMARQSLSIPAVAQADMRRCTSCATLLRGRSLESPEARATSSLANPSTTSPSATIRLSISARTAAQPSTPRSPTSARGPSRQQRRQERYIRTLAQPRGVIFFAGRTPAAT